MTDDLVTTTFVSGYGRSGSTIIELLLANDPTITVLGEVRHLFGRVVYDRELCGCGVEVFQCQYWGEILTEAFPDGYDRDALYRAFKRTNTMRALPQILVPALRSAAMRDAIDLYTRSFAAIYRAASAVSRKTCVVDSSKYPMHALTIAQARPDKNIRFNVMLLVRDPRAVANSWENPKVRPEIAWERRMMRRKGILRSGVAWILSNRLTEVAGRLPGVAYRVQRYEDFTAAPLAEINSIAEFVSPNHDELGDEIFSITRDSVHTIAGNPLDALKGSQHIEIRRDDAWRGRMHRVKQFIVAAVCLPQLRKYGYRFA